MSSLFPDLSSMIQYNRPEREVVTVDQVCILSEYSESTSELGKNGKKQKNKNEATKHGSPVPRDSAIKQAILSF